VRFYNEIGKLEFRYIPPLLMEESDPSDCTEKCWNSEKEEKVIIWKTAHHYTSITKKKMPIWQLIAMFSTYTETIILFG